MENSNIIHREFYETNCTDGVFVLLFIDKDGEFKWKVAEDSPTFDLQRVEPKNIKDADVLLAGVPYKYVNIRK